MTPYASLTYFLIVVAVMLPMIVAGARGKADGRWIIAATAVLLVVQYLKPLQLAQGIWMPELVALAAFGIFQWFLVHLALAKRLPGGSRWIIPLGLLPLAVAKFLPDVLPDSQFGFAGISYVTFRALDVLWMITDGVIAKVGLLDFVLFLFFFPTISSGPIDRFRRFKEQWRKQRSATEFWKDLDAGMQLIFRGLLYKFIIGTILERQAIHHTVKQTGVLGAIEHAYAYSAFLFFDFAGYSAFAVGVSRWFGIHTPPNFNRPWSAQNIREFWNRWHMSLSQWFRDHVYMRFLLVAMKGRWFKKRETASSVGYFVSFGLMGLWHGTAIYYILYGLYQAMLMAVFDAWSRWKKKNPQRFSGRLWKGAAHVLTIHAVIFGFWLFSGHGWKPKPVDPPPMDEPVAGKHHKGDGDADKR